MRETAVAITMIMMSGQFPVRREGRHTEISVLDGLSGFSFGFDNVVPLLSDVLYE
jgi:hypothetical protein